MPSSSRRICAFWPRPMTVFSLSILYISPDARARQHDQVGAVTLDARLRGRHRCLEHAWRLFVSRHTTRQHGTTARGRAASRRLRVVRDETVRASAASRAAARAERRRAGAAPAAPPAAAAARARAGAACSAWSASSRSSACWNATPNAVAEPRPAPPRRRPRRPPAQPRRPPAPPRNSAAVFSPCSVSSSASVAGAGFAQIARLPAHHPAHRRRRAPAPPTARRKSPGASAARAGVGDPLERQRQQRVAGQDRGRLAERLVVARAAAPEVVVVHRRQVVVDQRVAVHQLDRARRRSTDVVDRPAPSPTASAAASASSGRSRLPGRQQRVAHRLDQPPGIAARGRASRASNSASSSARARRQPGRSSESHDALRAHRASGVSSGERRGRRPARPAASRPSSRPRRGSSAPRRHSSIPSSNARRLSSSGRFPPSSRSTSARRRAEDVVEALGPRGGRRQVGPPSVRCRLRHVRPALSIAGICAKIPTTMAIETPPPELGRRCPDFRCPPSTARRYARRRLRGSARRWW